MMKKKKVLSLKMKQLRFQIQLLRIKLRILNQNMMKMQRLLQNCMAQQIKNPSLILLQSNKSAKKVWNFPAEHAERNTRRGPG